MSDEHHHHPDPKPEAAPEERAAWHRRFGIDANNRAWALSVRDRTPEQSREMLALAYVAAWHWSQIGTELQRMWATMLLAEAHALSGDGAVAIARADEMRAFFLFRDNAADWERALAHAIHAHAAAVAGRDAEHRASYALAAAAVAAIANDEDRRIVADTWRHVPKPADAPIGEAAALAAKLVRHIDEVATEPTLREPLYDAVSARLAVGTAARKLGASLDTVAPGKRACPYHLHHAQEEMFIVLDGRGAIRVAGEMLPVRRGSIVFVPPGPEYPHQIVNTSDEPLRYMSISTRDMPEICEYPDSGKYLAWSKSADGSGFDALNRSGDNLDYWDGEP